ncbi:MAG: tyrosinase family protein [Candidatus Tectomicrobia bacterium]|nr:tyrosinase family protein [Candidatus Tectomicrobia bacterium]
MATRKNVQSLSAAERSAFVQAVRTLKANGAYDQYILQHVQAMARGTPPGTPSATRNAAHRGPAFLPWHREYLRRLELDLQQVSGDPDLGLPYWDWAADAALANPATAPVWNNDFMGGQGNPVTTGPFAFNPADPNGWTIIDSQGNPAGGLIREFGVNVSTLPSQANVNAVLNVTPYDTSPWSTASSPSFRNQHEGWIGAAGPGLHNRVHVWVGGSMLPGTSPNDPIFFLHHCFVDKIWADWQARNPSQGYLPVSGGPAGHNLNDAMFPWTATPADVLDHLALGYEYDTDQPPVGQPTMTSPPPGSELSGTTVPFQWTANGSPVAQWWFYAGSTQGASDLYNSGSLGTSLSEVVTGLPTDGRQLFARLWYRISGSWQFSDFPYTAMTSGTPTILNPPPGATLSGATVPFQWTANGSPVAQWWLYVGSTQGASDLYNSGSLGTSLSEVVTGLPTDGRQLFARLWYRISGSWQFSDFPYTAA